MVDVHHPPVVSTEAYIMPPSVSVASLPVSRQLGSTGSSAPECSSTVSSHLALANCYD
jgi:hypothetical protein